MPPSLALAEAFYLGLLTSVLPCVLAQNVAAVSYIAKRMGNHGHALLSAALYLVGRSSVYVGVAVVCVTTTLSQDDVVVFLGRYSNRLAGPVLIITGMFILELLSFRGPSPAGSQNLQQRIDRGSLLAAILLGMLLALCFCPPVAAVYSRLILSAIEHQSPVALPLAFGAGTALPIAVVGVLVAVGAGSLAKVLDVMQAFQRWARRITGGVFILVGVDYSLVYIFGVPMPW